MATRALIPVEVYLPSVYRPGCDYVDGEVLERTAGERNHSRMLAALGSYLFTRRKALGIEVYPSLRLTVGKNRYRVPDLCVVLGATEEDILTEPPFLCIEILSPEDRMPLVWERLQDYFKMGVPNVWVIDPETRVANIATPSGDLRRVTDVLRTENPILEVPLAEIFE